MSLADWLGICSLILTVHGGGYMILNRRIDKAEDHTSEVVKSIWERAEKTFATKTDHARIEGKLDLILEKIQNVVEKVDERLR